MKQNERLLVYAVTGFLALILVVAVLFSREPGKDGQTPGKSQGLDEILKKDHAAKDGGRVADDDKTGKEKAGIDGNHTGLPSPNEMSAQQPLVAGAPKPMLAADLVAQSLGLSRRDRNVRFVRAKPNDSLEGLVRRWCGARDPYLAETMSLNEELKVLRVGQEVAVPWVEDEVLVAAIEAQKPKTLMPQDAVAGGVAPATGTPMPAAAKGGNGASGAQPSFAQPGALGSDVTTTRTPALGAGTSYTVKEKDSLWRIAERTYGRKHAERMIQAIKDANPGLTETVRPGQRIVLPPAPTGA